MAELQTKGKGTVAAAPNVPTKSKETTYKTMLTKAQDTYVNMLVNQAQDLNIKYSEYQITCALNAIASMHELLVKEGLHFNQVDQTNLKFILQTIAMLQINTASIPRECYLQLRNVKVKTSDGKDTWIRQFELGIEGDGNDAILRRNGVDVKTVHPFWAVREGDEFSYPSFNGLEINPPKWTPKSYTGKVVRVVYPIEKNNGTIEWRIAEREGVKTNLLAHISNNMMNETFGIIRSRYDKNVTSEQLEQIKQKKQEILDRLSNLSLEAILDDKEAQKWTSPAWSSPHSREAMILRKMRNNAIKPMPKDFKNAFAALEYERTFDDYEQYSQSAVQPDPEEQLAYEVETEANQEPLKTTVKLEDEEVKAEVVESPKPQTNSQKTTQENQPKQVNVPF